MGPADQYDAGLRRIKAVTALDPGALICVLQLLQARDVIPLRVMAKRVVVSCRLKDVLQIEIDVLASDITPEAFRLLSAQINQLPIVLTAIAG